jgi:hypothetical protein
MNCDRRRQIEKVRGVRRQERRGLKGKKATNSAFGSQVGKGKIKIEKIRGVRRQEDCKEEA